MNLGPCYSIPDRLVKELRQYDPALRLRWDNQECLVYVERYSEPARRYLMILKYEPYESLHYKLLPHLMATDVRRMGGARAVADQLERVEEFSKERRQWNRRDDFRYLATDLYKHMNTIKTVPAGAGHRAYGGF